MNVSTREALAFVLSRIDNDEIKLRQRKEQLERELDEVNGSLEKIRRTRTEIHADLEL